MGARIFTADPINVVGQKMTAAQYLRLYEPGVLELFLNPEEALAEDTERAATIAAELGKEVSSSGEYEPIVWALVYP